MKKILFIGLGSIGQRHLRNLRAIGGDFHFMAWRKRGNPLPAEFADVLVETFGSLEEALQAKPDICIISAPPVVQQEALPKVAEAGCHIFIEKPIAPSMNGLEDVLKTVKSKNLVTMVGYNLRFHPAYETIRSVLSEGLLGNISSVRASVGQWLPDWHPDEDYRQGYSAREDLGGGVILDLIHELDFVTGLFGDVKEVKSMYAKRSSIEVTVEDTAEILLRFESGVIGSVHIDYVQRRPFRNGMIVGDEGTLLYDLLKNDVQVLFADKNKDVHYKNDDFVRNDMYKQEMMQFLDAIDGNGKVESDLESGLKVLETALRAKAE